jgi:hypothetical protein
MHPCSSRAPLKMTTQMPYIPTHPDLFMVEFRPGDFASRLIALKVRLFRYHPSGSLIHSRFQSFKAGEVITGLFRFTKVPRPAYDTVQCGSGPGENIELHSDLVYGEWNARDGLRGDGNLLLTSSEPLLRAKRSVRPVFGRQLSVACASTETDQS